MDDAGHILCPSAQAHGQGAHVFGVVGGTVEAPAVAYLPVAQPVTEALLQLTTPVRPGEVFRIAAPCACSGCRHFAPEASTCRLAAAIVQWLPAVVDRLPPCPIRPTCRWWQQEGQAACVRCPQVVTETFTPLPEMPAPPTPALTQVSQGEGARETGRTGGPATYHMRQPSGNYVLHDHDGGKESMRRPYACVRQSDTSDCGAAALASIALHYRRPIGLQRLREIAGTDRSGTNLLGLLQAAEALGFAAKGVKGSYEALGQVPLPAIAHLRTAEGLGHFVVLYRVRPETVVVADPAHGLQKLARQDFCQHWTGALLLLVPAQQVSPPTVGGAPVSPWRRFLGLLSTHRAVLMEACCCALLMTGLGLATSYFIQHLVDSVLVRQEGRLLNALGLGMVLVTGMRTAFGMLRQYLVAYVGRKVALALIADYAHHILALPLSFFELRRVGEILSRVNDAAKVREAISGTTLTAVVDGTLVTLLVAALWLYDGPLALVATAFMPLLVLSAIGHHPAVRRRSRTALEETAQLSAHLVEDVSGVETVKACGAERQRIEAGEARLVSLVQAGFALEMLGMSMSAFGSFVTAMAGIVVLWYGGYRVMDGALTIGQLMFFYSLLGNLLGPLERLASVNIKLQEALIAVDRLYQILDLEAEHGRDDRKMPFQGYREALELHDVSFHYGCRAPVLEQVSLSIPAGKTVAIIGESGSGKSTLLKLLMGFYTPTAGRILLDGIDLQDVALASWRRRLGLVSQEPFIFNGTLRQNLTLGRPDATFAEVAAAARAAGLEAFIAQLPERYETMLGERGANLSGGQRQRLAIARALLQHPEILIFDEATSHLDTATEQAIQHSLRTALAGKTVVLVAHRLSTIKTADCIYVLHQGRIIQRGTHRELLAQEGRYRLLWQAQTEGAEGVLHARSAGVAAATASNGQRRLLQAEGGCYAD